MATATRVPARPVEDTRDVQLTLTRAEAQTLIRLVGYHTVGPADGPRRHTSAIFYALRTAGLESGGPLCDRDGRAETISLYPDKAAK